MTAFPGVPVGRCEHEALAFTGGKAPTAYWPGCTVCGIESAPQRGTPATDDTHANAPSHERPIGPETDATDGTV